MKYLFNRINLFFRNNWQAVLCWICLIILILLQLNFLYKNAEIVAGGDSYIHLQLGKFGLYPYAWDTTIPFGTSTHNIANLLGFELYSELFKGVPAGLIQRFVFFTLYLLQFIGFAKLTSLFHKKLSVFAIIPVLIIARYGAFQSLSPIAYFSMMYAAYLPLSIYYFVKIVDSPRLNLVAISKLTILSIIFSPINSNLALSATIFIPQVLYLVVYLRRITKYTVINLSIYLLLFVLANLWWSLPLIRFFVISASGVLNGSSWFNATGAGNLFQNFRLLGQWGWYGVHFLHAYYPFSQYYDNPIIIIISFSVIIAAFFQASKQYTDRDLDRYRIFFHFLAIISLFLISGSRYPLGGLYQFLFDHLPGFKMFREPFTKFGELYIVSISIFLYLFLANIGRRLSGFKKALVFLVILIGAISISLPSLVGDHVPSFWNGSARTLRISVPKYWRELEEFGKKNLKGSRVIVSPNSSYGGAWNWPKGFSSADDVSVNFLYNDVNVIRYPLPTGSDTDTLLKSFYSALKDGNNYQKYLSIMGVDYVLHENDFDWRYSSLGKTPVEISDSLSKKLIKIEEFGLFDKEYLSQIVNEDPDPNIRESLGKTLLGQPALILYKVPEDLRTPKIYIPEKIHIIRNDLRSEQYPKIVLSGEFGSHDIFTRDKKVTTLVTKGEPSLEFNQINPTKYEIIVSGSPSEFYIQFSERYDSGWKLSSPTGYIEDNYHLKTNDYSNGWIINKDSLEDAVLEYKFTLEFLPQRQLNFNLALLVIILTVCSIIVLADIIRKTKNV